MAFPHYTEGALITLTGTYTDASGAVVDPTNAEVDILGPNNVTHTYQYSGGTGAVTRVSAGVYTYALDTTGLPGRFQWRWFSPPGTGQTANAGQLIVDPYPATVP